MRRSLQLSLLALASSFAFTTAGCLSDDDDNNNTASDAGAGTDSAPIVTGDSSAVDPSTADNADALAKYVPYQDDLTKHPGCSTAGLTTRVSADPNGPMPAYTPVVLAGYPCAGKEYAVPADDATSTKPIIILVHGNSSSPLDWETSSKDPTAQPMISEGLVKDGFHVYAVDFRWDLVTDDPTKNPAKNFDHGWAVPILESFVKAIVAKYPTRKINMAGFSVGTTVVRDALRRLHRADTGIFSHLNVLYLASGANHGVSTFELYCGNVDDPINMNLLGLAACQLGSRANYVPVPFLIPLNGPGTTDSFDTPCADGSTAYGQTGVCGGNTVKYTTVVFADPANGPLQDEFVDQASAKLTGATNTTVTETDTSGYFFAPNFIHHFGSIRSAMGVSQGVAALEQ
jgi:pimeloyl-ACP methyl ester carboxylesterase